MLCGEYYYLYLTFRCLSRLRIIFMVHRKLASVVKGIHIVIHLFVSPVLNPPRSDNPSPPLILSSLQCTSGKGTIWGIKREDKFGFNHKQRCWEEQKMVANKIIFNHLPSVPSRTNSMAFSWTLTNRKQTKSMTLFLGFHYMFYKAILRSTFNNN